MPHLVRRGIDRMTGALVAARHDGSSRRRPGDAVRIAIAVVALVALGVHSRNPSAIEDDIVRALRDLPDGAESTVRFLWDLLAVWAVVMVVLALGLLRRVRLGRDVAVAAAATWLVGRLLSAWARQDSWYEAFSVVWDHHDAPRFPLVRVAVAVAIVTVSSAYLTRPARRTGQAVVALLAIAGIYLGSSGAADVVAAFVLGWGMAAVVHLAFGTPARRPTVDQVTRALHHLGVDAADVRATHDQPLGRAIFLADGHGAPDAERTDPTERLRVVAIGRDEADAQFLARAGRWLAYRDAPPVLVATRRRQVEHEAFSMLLAREHGVRTPIVVSAASSGTVALLVTEDLPGKLLDELPPEGLSHAALADVWVQVAHLHGAQLSHGRLDGSHLLVDGDRVGIVGWERAAGDAGVRRQANDVAQVLAATAVVVGAEDAVRAAAAGVPDDVLREALPLLQPNALTHRTRDLVDDREGLLDELRDRTAAALGTEAPAPRALYRVNPRQLIMAVAALFAIAVLLSRVGDPVEFWNSVRDANWWWVGLAFLLGILTDVSFAIAFIGTVPVRIGVWPSIELQSSMSFSNLAVPVAADTAVQVRFLQKNGLDLSSAVATGGVLSTVAELVVQGALFGLALWLTPDTIDFGRIDTGQIVVVVLAAVFVVGVATAVVMLVRRIRHAVVPRVVRASKTVWAALKHPGRFSLLIGGNVVAHCLYAASLLACLHAFGTSIDFWTLLALNIGISLIASLVPFPGGGTAVSAVGLSGMLTAVGVPASAATAAVIAHQLAVVYIPAIPGWFATNDLIRKRLL